MVSFYPGPSRVHDEIPKWVKAAHRKGVMSMNHRSPEFIALSKKTVGLLKEKLDIPDDYTVLFTSSATECWEIIAQSLVHTTSVHFFNGSFGEKWFDYTHRIKQGATAVRFEIDRELKAEKLNANEGDILCITQNETSNGTQVPGHVLQQLRKKNPEPLIAVDVTSSMAGIQLDFNSADIWFASVQKCFGLPAGLGIMLCSPRAIQRAALLDEKDHYNSLSFMADMMEKWQTPNTPNVLGIYLLMRVLKEMEIISRTHKKITNRATSWWKFFKGARNLKLLIPSEGVRSHTVIAIVAQPEVITRIKLKASKKGFLLGEGYGDLRKTTIRIANFPALSDKEVKQLKGFLKDYR